MIDVDCYATIAELLSIIDHSKRDNACDGDALGNVHVILFGDFKYPYLSGSSGSYFCYVSILLDLILYLPSACVKGSCRQRRPGRLSSWSKT